MKNLKQLCFVCLLACLAIFAGCEREAVLEVVTIGCSDIGSNTATLQGSVSYDGDADITSGFYYDLNSDMSNALVSNSTTHSTGSFTAAITGLRSSATYYYQAYAIADGTVVKGEVKSFATNSGNGTLNGHDYVDLGLSVKWATCNVGSTTPQGCGKYYAWGETEPKDTYNSSTYNYSDNPTTLPADHDAATANWGSSWRMPTETEMRELIDYCTWTCGVFNGVNGYHVAGTNGNSIFLPAAGYRNGTESYYVGSYGNYWSSSVYDSSLAWYLGFSSDYHGMSYYVGRYCGLSVRPVRP